MEKTANMIALATIWNVCVGTNNNWTPGNYVSPSIS